MVKPQSSKLITRVRFPSSPPNESGLVSTETKPLFLFSRFRDSTCRGCCGREVCPCQPRVPGPRQCLAGPVRHSRYAPVCISAGRPMSRWRTDTAVVDACTCCSHSCSRFREQLVGDRAWATALLDQASVGTRTWAGMNSCVGLVLLPLRTSAYIALFAWEAGSASAQCEQVDVALRSIGSHRACCRFAPCGQRVHRRRRSCTADPGDGDPGKAPATAPWRLARAILISDSVLSMNRFLPESVSGRSTLSSCFATPPARERSFSVSSSHCGSAVSRPDRFSAGERGRWIRPIHRICSNAHHNNHVKCGF